MELKYFEVKNYV